MNSPLSPSEKKPTSEKNSNNSQSNDDIILRQPGTEDGFAIFKLIQQSPPLDLNSCYSYLLLCTHWRDTCVVATHKGKIAGFISAYIPPNQPDTLFVWQVAVDKEQRGKGLAMKMLENLLNREKTTNISYMETTITPDNSASHSLFKRFSDTHHAPLNIGMGYSAEDFGDSDHLPELLYRIGPIER